ncbi:transketolase subunit A [Syntrophobotulus glycolicus DSM 8271]|uniref:Transketolase subunit A n=1 Tax=Syntrophobotulus glycolicus (strain DSM 8271 / FlGlyR) TaxID=645991 RepID=F0SW22_SYNGF|nr:transketolase [Syntrophobotulus glycolicus]ADY56806.1 transketolase subunit A [Syntrophobotulus glycolicus DSM 8271]
MSQKEKQLEEAKRAATNMRRNILLMTHRAKGGHPGGCLSATDLLAVLYKCFMRIDPAYPKSPDRDYFLLSKGHAVPALYAVLIEKGFLSQEEINDFRELEGRLPAYPSCELTPGVDMASGSLGQGLSIANGIALSCRLKGSDQRAYCMLGDGELHEGQCWEAMLTAAHFKLNNVCAIVDYNKLQLDGSLDEVKSLGDLRAKWDAFDWHTIEIDGHDLSQIYDAFAEAENYKKGPSVIIANTIKGKGVSFMEDEVGWHAAAPNDEQLQKALKELS